MNPYLGIGIGAVAGAALYALLLQPEKPCSVVWAGKLSTKSDDVVSKLVNNGFTIPDGTLKQDTTPDGMTVFMVKPSAATKAAALVAAVK
jgi:hypothetical protein